MRYMWRVFLFWACLGSSTGWATEPTLTDREQYCALLGTLAHAITVDRNAGVPLTTTIAQLRALSGDETFAALAMAIYSDYPHEVRPDQARQITEMGCLKAIPATPPTAPSRKGRSS